MDTNKSIPAQPANQLLARLPPAEYSRLSPLLESVPLDHKQIICRVRAPVSHVYFPETGMVSAMTIMNDGSAIEVATIGNEGMAGLTALIGDGGSPNEMMVQVPGRALRMRADRLKEESRRDGPLRSILVLYNTAFAVQVSYSVACNGLHTVQKRCCRWLLMTHDRVGDNVLPLTHEFLAIMLGVRRASITEVLRPLQRQGMVRNRRGKIEIVDRDALESHSCECYRSIKQEFERLLG